MPREKSRYRDRRSSSYSSDSSYDRKKSKSKHKRRSRSRDRSESSSHRRKRSTSRPRHRKRSYSRSVSRERYEKSRRRSTSRSRSRRDRSHSRSSTRKISKKSRRRSRSSGSRSSSYDIGNECDSTSSEELSTILSSLLHLNLKSKNKPLLSSYFSKRPLPPKLKAEDNDLSKVEKAIKAAEAAGVTLTKIPTYEYKEVEIKEDMPTIHDRNLLAEINSDSFVQKSFVSSSKKKESKNIVIDLNSQTVKLPDMDIKQKDESIINFDEIPNEEELKEMWIKKLYQYRKRMLRGEI